MQTHRPLFPALWMPTVPRMPRCPSPGTRGWPRAVVGVAGVKGPHAEGTPAADPRPQPQPPGVGVRGSHGSEGRRGGAPAAATPQIHGDPPKVSLGLDSGCDAAELR